MWRARILLTLVTVLIAVVGVIESDFTPAGKCDMQRTKSTPLQVSKLEKYLKWKVWYATQVGNKPLDHELIYIAVEQTGSYVLGMNKVFKDKSKTTYHSVTKYVPSGSYFVEDAEDDNGNKRHNYQYPLAITSGHGVLFYVCSDVGNPHMYYRYISFPANSTPTESEIEQLLAVDKAVFGESRGTLVKLQQEVED